MSFSYVWPIALVVIGNTLYQICAKSVPADMHPMASLTATYLVGAAISAVLYFIMEKEPSLIREYSRINWAPLALGIVVVALEVGFIYAYRAGWPVSTAQVVQSSFLAVMLLIVGALLYHEVIGWNKVIGIIICLIGLAFINK